MVAVEQGPSVAPSQEYLELSGTTPEGAETSLRLTLWCPTTFIYESKRGPWIVRALEEGAGDVPITVVEFSGPQTGILEATKVVESPPSREFYRKVFAAGLFFSQKTPTDKRPEAEKWPEVCVSCGHPAHLLNRRVVLNESGQIVREERLDDLVYCIPLFADFHLPNEEPRKQKGCNAVNRRENVQGRRVRMHPALGWEDNFLWFKAFKVHEIE